MSNVVSSGRCKSNHKPPPPHAQENAHHRADRWQRVESGAGWAAGAHGAGAGGFSRFAQS